MRYLSATYSALLAFPSRLDCDSLTAVSRLLSRPGGFSLQCLSLNIYIPLPDVFTRPRPPLEVQLLHLHRKSLQWLEAITLGFLISGLRIVQLPVRASPCNICNRVPVPFTVVIPDARWGHVPASDGLEHCRATVKVIHAFGVLACQAFMAAYHGERHHFEAGKKGGTRCENAAEGVMARVRAA